MKPFRGAVWSFALLLLGGSVSPVQAAWCNAFQVCWHRHPQATASYYAAPDPCCNPCPPPQPVCTTRYVQRCYYQPVTCYQTKTYYEPVTTYRTSYYYEPVQSYRYSCYYDPCTCSYQQVACPTTSYQLRSQCCPVQSWVQRCCQVPVTNYQQSFYWEPVTTCCTPTCPTCPQTAAAPGATAYASPAPGCNGAPGYAPGYVPGAQAPPAVSEPRAPVAPGISEYPGRIGGTGLQYDRNYGPVPGTMPPASGSSYRQLVPQAPLPAQNPAFMTPPTVKLDRIVALPVAEIEGQVMGRNKAPWAGVLVLFVPADQREPRQTVAADQAGKFRVSLISGGWLVYIQGPDGKLTFQRKLEVGGNETRQVNLVSR